MLLVIDPAECLAYLVGCTVAENPTETVQPMELSCLVADQPGLPTAAAGYRRYGHARRDT